MDAHILFILKILFLPFSTVLAVGLSKWLSLYLGMIFLYLFSQDFYHKGIWIYHMQFMQQWRGWNGC